MKKVVMMLLCIGQITMVTGAVRPAEIVFERPVGSGPGDFNVGPRKEPKWWSLEGIGKRLNDFVAGRGKGSTSGARVPKSPVVASAPVDVVEPVSVAGESGTTLLETPAKDRTVIGEVGRPTVSFADRFRSLFGRTPKENAPQTFTDFNSEIDRIDEQVGHLRSLMGDQKRNPLLAKEVLRLLEVRNRLNNELVTRPESEQSDEKKIRKAINDKKEFDKLTSQINKVNGQITKLELSNLGYGDNRMAEWQKVVVEKQVQRLYEEQKKLNGELAKNPYYKEKLEGQAADSQAERKKREEVAAQHKADVLKKAGLQVPESVSGKSEFDTMTSEIDAIFAKIARRVALRNQIIEKVRLKYKDLDDDVSTVEIMNADIKSETALINKQIEELSVKRKSVEDQRAQQFPEEVKAEKARSEALEKADQLKVRKAIEESKKRFLVKEYGKTEEEAKTFVEEKHEKEKAASDARALANEGRDALRAQQQEAGTRVRKQRRADSDWVPFGYEGSKSNTPVDYQQVIPAGYELPVKRTK